MQPKISALDNLLSDDVHKVLWQFLNMPGWAYGGYSSADTAANLYFYKHFAGFAQSGDEERTPDQVERELRDKAPLLADLWDALTKGPLAGHRLARCYANGMPAGLGGGVHRDSNHADHLTAIYYPNLEWSPNEGGETVFLNDEESDIVAAVAPKPNRMVIFSGTIPHVARPTTRSGSLRITLMFKTWGTGH